MNVLISPNAFKGTISAQKAGEIISEFMHTHLKNVVTQISPIADGGDGTCELLTHELNLVSILRWSLDAYGLPIPSFFGWDKEKLTAYIDVSTASGLASLSGKVLSPSTASTYGTGRLIQHALDLGAEEIVLGLGGSATIDLGFGILAAIGLEFLDEKGRAITLFSPDYLKKIQHIQRSPTIPKVNFTCLCDVRNPLFGESGAVPIFGVQKGLAYSAHAEFEETCKNLIAKLYRKVSKTFIDKEGFGAAGGIAAGLSAFFPTAIQIGSSYFFNQVGLDLKVDWADLIITGEGKYDAQSKEGKACFELLRLAKASGKRIILISSGQDGIEDGFDDIISLPDLDLTLANLQEIAAANLRDSLLKSLSSNIWA